MAVTTRRANRYPVGGDSPPDVPLWMSRLATDLDDAPRDNQGVIGSRPPASGVSPRSPGEWWISTDEQDRGVTRRRIYRGHGTGYDELATLPISPRMLEGVDTYEVTTAVTDLDLTVNSAAERLWLIDWELQTLPSGQITLQPNGAATLFHQSREGTIHTFDGTTHAQTRDDQVGQFAGVRLIDGRGATGFTVSTGRLSIGAVARSASRVARAEVAWEQSAGGANFMDGTQRRSARLASVTEPIASLRLHSSVASGIVAGTVRVQRVS